MDDVGTGIRIQTSGSIPSLVVEQNTINNSNAIGISLVNADAKKHSVSSNIITVVGPYGKGIEFMNLVETPVNGNIEWNDIDLYGKNYGIDMNLSEGGIIRENNINLHSDQDFSGVHLTGVTSGSFNCNRITGVSSTYDPGSDQSIAFDINNSTGVEYRCNYLDETSIGFRYTGLNVQSSSSLLQTDVTGNSINSHGYGFMMQSDALFGSFTSQNVMAHKGNTWDGDYGNDKAIHFGLMDQVSLSRFKVHTNNLPYYPHSVDQNNPEAPAPPLPNAPGVTWFEVINDGNPYACSQQDCPQEQITENDPDSIGVLGLAIARDSLDFTSEFDEALTWALKRCLYRILDDYPTLQYQDSSLLQFYTDVANSSIGAFTAVDHLKKAILSVDTSVSAQIILWNQEIENRLDSIRAAEEEFPAEPDSSDIELLAALQGAYLIEIDSFANLQQKLRCTEWSSKIELVDSASVLNAGIQPVTQMEINEQVVNQVYFDKTFFGQFNLAAGEIDQLDTIAYQCPTLGGRAVFSARGILAASGQFGYYDDDSLCQAATSRYFYPPAYSKNTESNAVTVFPNPATDLITIQLKGLKKGGMAEIDISGILGYNMIRRFAVNRYNDPELIEVPLAGIPPGIYLVRVYVEDKIFGSKKFIVCK